MSVFKKVAWTGTAKSEAQSGNTDADTLNGMGGADTLKGLAGGDDLYGGNGRDVIYGGAGDDFIGGDKGGDRLFGGTGSDRIYVSGLDTATGGAGADQFVILDPGNGGGDQSDLGTVIIRDFDAVGADRDLMDLHLFGDHSGVRWQHRDKGLEDNFEMFRQGDDTILRLKGQEGTIVKVVIEDVLPGQLTEDHFFFFTEKQRSAFESANWTGTARADTKSGTAGNDSEMDGRAGNDTIKGLAGDDNIKGGKGADLIYGGSGEDRIYVSGGDRVYGGRGADDFVMLDYGGNPTMTDKGVATVKDFQVKGAQQDTISLTIFSGLEWKHRDKGLEDGLEIIAKGGDTLIRVKGQNGVINTLRLEDVSKAALAADHFEWPFIF
jgi:Ca2+-binding RTX toxin-like protein